MNTKLTQKELKEMLHYDPIAGIFTWRVIKSRRVKVGQIAGYIKPNGYRQIEINSNPYYASRLAFLYMEGYFPENDVDHINRIRYDNRWKNLRHVSRQCNLRNSYVQRDSISKITGVNLDKRTNRWKSRIFISGKEIHLGCFSLKVDAARVRWNAEVKHDFPNCNTTSSAFQYLQNHV